jgi:hypothetical protein
LLGHEASCLRTAILSGDVLPKGDLNIIVPVFKRGRNACRILCLMLRICLLSFVFRFERAILGTIDNPVLGDHRDPG